MDQYPNSQFLVSADWLQSHLADPDLRIIDASVALVPDPKGTYTVESGRADWQQAHIPGSCYIDIQQELSRKDTGLRFSFPSAEQFGQVVGDYGIGNDSTVVIYATASFMWATRLWYMFRAFGMQRVAVLDGGLTRWQADGRPTDADVVQHAPVQFNAVFDARRVVDKAEVQKGITQEGVVILNALGRDQHRGEGMHYGRPGRIKGSCNVPARELVEESSGLLKSADELHSLFSAVGAFDADRVINYCGGGIAATGTAFALTLLGYEDRVALYDASMSEWANDPDAPMETG